MIVDLGSHTNMPHLKRKKLYHYRMSIVQSTTNIRRECHISHAVAIVGTFFISKNSVWRVKLQVFFTFFVALRQKKCFSCL